MRLCYICNACLRCWHQASTVQYIIGGLLSILQSTDSTADIFFDIVISSEARDNFQSEIIMSPKNKDKGKSLLSCPLPPSSHFFYIDPPGSGRIVQGRSAPFENSLTEAKIWKNYDKKMAQIRRKEKRKSRNHPELSTVHSCTAESINKPLQFGESRSQHFPGAERRNTRYNLRNRQSWVNSYKENGSAGADTAEDDFSESSSSETGSFDQKE